MNANRFWGLLDTCGIEVEVSLGFGLNCSVVCFLSSLLV